MTFQANAFIRHPRHIDINYARLPIRVAGAAVQVERWRAIQRSGASDLSTEPIPAIDQAKGPNFVMAFGGSSMGNVSFFSFRSAKIRAHGALAAGERHPAEIPR